LYLPIATGGWFGLRRILIWIFSVLTYYRKPSRTSRILRNTSNLSVWGLVWEGIFPFFRIDFSNVYLPFTGRACFPLILASHRLHLAAFARNSKLQVCPVTKSTIALPLHQKSYKGQPKSERQLELLNADQNAVGGKGYLSLALSWSGFRCFGDPWPGRW
jgi:hypothetical protein